MLTQSDINFMQNSIRSMIKVWNDEITISTPLSRDQQPNWNNYMNEFTGDILYYDEIVPAERRFFSNTKDNLILEIDKAGDKFESDIYYSISDEYNLDKYSIVKIDDSGEQYIINNIKMRLGEQIIQLIKLVG